MCLQIILVAVIRGNLQYRMSVLIIGLRNCKKLTRVKWCRFLYRKSGLCLRRLKRGMLEHLIILNRPADHRREELRLRLNQVEAEVLAILIPLGVPDARKQDIIRTLVVFNWHIWLERPHLVFRIQINAAYQGHAVFVVLLATLGRLAQQELLLSRERSACFFLFDFFSCNSWHVILSVVYAPTLEPFHYLWSTRATVLVNKFGTGTCKTWNYSGTWSNSTMT